MERLAKSGKQVAARESNSIQEQILTAFLTTEGGEKKQVLAAKAVLRGSNVKGSLSSDDGPIRRLLFAAGLIPPSPGAAGLASPVGGPDSPATPATTAAGIGDGNGAATKMLATLAPDEQPPAKRAAVAEGSEAKPASKAKAAAPTKAVGAPAAAKSKAVSNAEATGKGKGDARAMDAHSNAGAKAAATAAPVPKTTQGDAALKQVKLLGFLVRPKPSTEPTAPPTAAMGGAE